MRRVKSFLEGFIFFLVILVGFTGCGENPVSEGTPEEEVPQTMNAVLIDSEPGVTVVSRAPAPTSSPSSSSTTESFTPLSKNPFERDKIIQRALKGAGFYGGAVDGKMGPLTQKAILDFQRSAGLQIDGKVGPITWRALEKHLPEGETP